MWSWIDRAAPELDEHTAVCASCRELTKQFRASIHSVEINATPSRPPLPQQVGAYSIKRYLGEGSQGWVYEAEHSALKRPVALKVVKGGRFVTELDVKLLQREAHTLARLSHPAIAAIFEVGLTEEGQHFFAMELVPGVPLYRYTQTAKPSLHERLVLFRKVCDAINYAHQRGVIHRDLKPSNIIIDAEGNPRILDFGLARVMDAETPYSTLLTRKGKLLGTPAYMSPEQTCGDPDEIDTRSDVYALGVILYELMTGALPYDVRNADEQQVRRVVCEQSPRRPGLVNRAVRGDVETIILKALEKDPARRYQSPLAIAEDVDRYLAGEPILAHAPSVTYRLGKFAKRHRHTIGRVTVTTTLLAAFAYLVLHTNRTLDQLDRVNIVLWALMYSPSYLAALVGGPDGDGHLREVDQWVASELAGSPIQQATMYNDIGAACRQAGRLDDAQRYWEMALRLQRQSAGSENPVAATILFQLASLLCERRDYDAAEARCREALAMRRERLPERHPAIADLLIMLGQILTERGKPQEAEPLLRQAIEVYSETLAPEHWRTAQAESVLGECLLLLGQRDAAEPLLRRSYPIIRAALGDANWQTQAALRRVRRADAIRDTQPRTAERAPPSTQP
ncbi:MAG: serine/threonine-protein kinase [Planctomycetes bacterium]|nr:serine/threonine-protein kinase [Planctomycetota bacterium]